MICKEFILWHSKKWKLHPLKFDINNCMGNYSNIWIRRRSRVEDTLDWEAGRDCLFHCMGKTPSLTWGGKTRHGKVVSSWKDSVVFPLSWWNWELGSRLLFWRWPKYYHKQARDGIKMWWSGSLPRWIRRQLPPKNNLEKKLLQKKIRLVLERNYVDSGQVSSLVPLFWVPKGADDVRVVYNGAKSGLNEVMWAPNFPVPNAEQLIRIQEPGTWNVDLDISDHFLNFMMPTELRSSVGIDLTPIFKEDSKSYM